MADLGKCRYCGTELKYTFADLGMSPLSNAYVTATHSMERFFPLHAYVCHNCFLVQLHEYESPEEIFSEYAYFSSYSESWLHHAKAYVDRIVHRQGLTEESFVLEIASNDGYLLQYFLEKSIPVLGVEPAKNVAKMAINKGIPTVTAFFNLYLAEDLCKQEHEADLVIANNVFAHVPDIHDFIKGIHRILKKKGIATLEFPSLLNLIRFNQFDTIYHEHFSYLSFTVASQMLRSHGLKVFDVEELPTHGGSLRVYVCKHECMDYPISSNVQYVLHKENEYGLNRIDPYLAFSDSIRGIKRKILKTLIAIKEQGKSIIAYGAAAKGNTLLNYCGIREDFLDYIVDISPHKQGKYLPGTHLFIQAPERIEETKPDYILILPWNIKDEIIAQLRYTKEWGCQFIVPIPEIEVIP